MNQEDPRKEWVRNLGLFGVIVSDFIGFVGGGIGLGYLLVTKLDFPWITVLLMALFGLVAASYRLYQVYKKIIQEDASEDKSK